MRAIRKMLAGMVACAMAMSLPARATEPVNVVEAAWVKAMETANIPELTKCFAPDALVWVGGLPAADNQKAISMIFRMYLGQNHLKDIKLAALGAKTLGEVSVSWGTYSATSVPTSNTGQGPTHLEGRYTNIAKKLNGRWVFAVNHLSEEPPQFVTPPPDEGGGGSGAGSTGK